MRRPMSGIFIVHLPVLPPRQNPPELPPANLIRGPKLARAHEPFFISLCDDDGERLCFCYFE
jgi:hypothetical protein